VRAHLRHPGGLADPVGLPELHGVRAGLAHRAEPGDPAPDQYHGAKFYTELADADVSADFLDAVTARFDGVADTTAPADRDPDHAGLAAALRLVEDYDLGDPNLVKPGVGETTRVLLRRVPWRVLVDPAAPPADLAHVRLLAQRRGVPVEEVPGLPYRCVGLIHPATPAAPPAPTAAARRWTAPDGSSARRRPVTPARPGHRARPVVCLTWTAPRSTPRPRWTCAARPRGAAAAVRGGVPRGAAVVHAEAGVAAFERCGRWPRWCRPRRALPSSWPGCTCPARRPLAVASNGGHLLVDGVPDPDWTAAVQARLAGCAPPGDQRAPARGLGEFVLNLRLAAEMFAYAVVDRAALPVAWVADLAAWCAPRGWAVSLQGRKVYAVPRPLTKSAAAAEVLARTGGGPLLAAGDSLLDADLLRAADIAVRPAHGELAETGFTLPHLHVTAATGAAAGAELLGWLGERAAVAAAPRPSGRL
jgi:hypothetical protein